MTDRIKYYDEVSSSLRSIVKDTNIVTYGDFLVDMKDFIIDKGFWKSKLTKVAKDLKYSVETDNNINTWASIVAKIKDNRTKAQHRQRSESTPSSLSSSPNRVLTSAEKALVLEYYNNIQEKNKGALSTGKNLTRDSMFEHPVHSYIFDTSDPVWKTYFTAEELKEAKSDNTKLVVDIPEELQALLTSF